MARPRTSTLSVVAAYPALVLCMVMAAAPRFYRLDAPALDNPEAFSWRLIQYPAGELIARTAGDVHPPGYYLLLKAWTLLFGDGAGAIRAFSATAGVAAVGLAYLAVREAASWRRGDDRGKRNASACWTGVLAAGLLALHGEQIAAARTARMYSLGVALALLTSWLLLVAMRRTREEAGGADDSHGGQKTHKGAFWIWTGYAVAAASFLYTHNYALFTLAAQGAFVVGACVIHRSAGWRTAANYSTATLGAAALYSPWLPVLLAQIAAVKESYWIEPASWESLKEMLFVWITGWLLPAEKTELVGAVAAVAAILICSAWRRPQGWLLFALGAATPWAIGLLHQFLADRPILISRYLVFAQASLCCLAATAIGSVPWLLPRLWLATAALLALGVGTEETAVGFPSERPGLAKLFEQIKPEHQRGDLFLVGSSLQVNGCLYYAKKAGIADPRVVCGASFDPAMHHVMHFASLEDSNVVSFEDLARFRGRRMWVIGKSGESAARPGMQVVFRASAEGPGPGDRGWRAVLHERR